MEGVYSKLKEVLPAFSFALHLPPWRQGNGRWFRIRRILDSIWGMRIGLYKDYLLLKVSRKRCLSDDPPFVRVLGTGHGMKWHDIEGHSGSNVIVSELNTTRIIAPGNYLHLVIRIHQSSLSISRTQMIEENTILCTISNAWAEFTASNSYLFVSRAFNTIIYP